MKKSLLFIASVLMTINLYAYSDSDMDGVDDTVDSCPNSLLTDLVDISGCTKKSLVSPHSYDIIIGVNYSNSDYRSLNATDTLASSLQVDYYYKQFSLQASTSFFKTEGSGYSDSGLYDSFLGASYRLNPINNLSISLSAGALLPTYDTELKNNNTDYTASVNLSYTLDNFNIFGGYSYSLINDYDMLVTLENGNSYSVIYQNTNAFSGGLGYYLSSNLYVSASYSMSDSIYVGVDDIETATVYGYYSINKDIFTTLSYSYGLSDAASDDYISLRLGFLF